MKLNNFILITKEFGRVIELYMYHCYKRWKTINTECSKFSLDSRQNGVSLFSKTLVGHNVIWRFAVRNEIIIFVSWNYLWVFFEEWNEISEVKKIDFVSKIDERKTFQQISRINVTHQRSILRFAENLTQISYPYILLLPETCSYELFNVWKINSN